MNGDCFGTNRSIFRIVAEQEHIPDRGGTGAYSGSACNSGSMTPSHVLLAMGVPYRIAHGSLRLSFGVENREEEIPVLIREIREVVKTLRK